MTNDCPIRNVTCRDAKILHLLYYVLFFFISKYYSILTPVIFFIARIASRNSYILKVALGECFALKSWKEYLIHNLKKRCNFSANYKI